MREKFVVKKYPHNGYCNKKKSNKVLEKLKKLINNAVKTFYLILLLVLCIIFFFSSIRNFFFVDAFLMYSK